MFKLIRVLSPKSAIFRRKNSFTQIRTLLSQSYYCQEVWKDRLNSPIIQKVNLDELYYELDQRFQRTRQIVPVDVDIFAHAIKDNVCVEELMDLMHKLRLSAETGSTLNSTSHATVRAVSDFGSTSDLLNMLDDRLNYGVFIDYYLANILMDKFWKNEDFVSGVRVASQLMLQEESDHELYRSFALLHIYNYLIKPADWPQAAPPEEPEEEVKVRVKYLRNPFDDDHFDLKDPKKITGKTLISITENSEDSVNKSFNIIGWILYDKPDKAQELIELCTKNNTILVKEILDLLPESKELFNNIKTISIDIQKTLLEQVEKAQRNCAEKDVQEQSELYRKWENERIEALEAYKTKLLDTERAKNIEELKKSLKEKEQKLWFFENEEQIELDIEGKKIFYPKRWFGNKKTPRKVDQNYVPPEIK